jgi:hypothetical protein
MDCRCNEVTELYGREAGDYVAGHLHPDGAAFTCPDTGARWELDDSDAEQTRLTRTP